MKLSEHTEKIRVLIDTAFRNRLGRVGISEGAPQPINTIPQEYHADRKRMETIREVFISETGAVKNAYEKLVEELTFTLFNRLAALKVMEAHTLHPEIVTRRESHGGRSFAHLAWLEQHPEARTEDAEGILTFLEEQLQKLSGEIPLFSPQYPYHLLPTALELSGIIHAFNQVESDDQVEPDIWKSDDVLGWLYESYNNYKKKQHKDSGDKTEYNKVSIQSQVYTPRWVVKFLVDNSLGKLYLEMHPDSRIRDKYQIAFNPEQLKSDPLYKRENKSLHEIKLIDPSCGSGNFLLYAFDLFYDLYEDQIAQYGADYDLADVPRLIVQNNLHGIDLDDRSVQLAQLGLYIKAKRKKRTAKIEHFNVVSSDFFLPEYKDVKHLFENGEPLDPSLEKIVMDLWDDLQQAYKFGSLIRLEEEFTSKLNKLIKKEENTLFMALNEGKYEDFRENFFSNLQKAIAHNAARQGQTFLNTKTQDAITFLELLTQKYDVAVANPPYTPSDEYGEELREFVEANYKKPVNTYENLYACFILRCFNITEISGYISMITPQTFMFIDSFKNLREHILNHTFIDILVQYGFGGIFKESVDPCFFILKKCKPFGKSTFLKFDTTFGSSKNQVFQNIINSGSLESNRDHVFILNQKELQAIKGHPFIFWISNSFRKKFEEGSLDNYLKVCQGLATGDNNRFLRFHWEVDDTAIKTWIPYAKGGTFNKWSGNLWLTVNWQNNGFEIRNFRGENGRLRSRLQNETYYFKNGITYSASGRGGYAFRILPAGCIFDVGGSSIFLTKDYQNIFYSLGLLNSTLVYYIADCLNPTANIQVGDIQRIPFVRPPQEIESLVSISTQCCIESTEIINSFKLIEPNYSKNVLSFYPNSSIYKRILEHLIYETFLKTRILLNEAIINKCIFDVYCLEPNDIELISSKVGISVCELPLLKEAKIAFLSQYPTLSPYEINFIEEIPLSDFDPLFINDIQSKFSTLYNSSVDLSNFCINNNLNPINAWYWFKEVESLPQVRSREITVEFLIDAVRTLLLIDNDGIIPMVGLPSEPQISHRLEQYCVKNGFTSSQYMQIDHLLGTSLNDFLDNHFFKYLCDYLNPFSNLPKTPFIWHLSSGEHQGFEAYILIYKWNRDSLFKLKSQYISQRVQNLEYRQIQLQDVHTAQAQNEKEKIRLQLREIENFTKKIDELIAEGYDPKLDDGVGKNIAPLQKKGMLRAEVLKSAGKNSQLEKYLNADW